MIFFKKNIATIVAAIIAAALWFLIWYQWQPATSEKIQSFISESDCNKNQVNRYLFKDSSNTSLTNSDLGKIVKICKKMDNNKKLSSSRKEKIKESN